VSSKRDRSALEILLNTFIHKGFSILPAYSWPPKSLNISANSNRSHERSVSGYEVLAPESFRKEIKALIGNMIQAYK